MSSSPLSRGPLPRFDQDSSPFWQGCAAGELRVQRCRQCESMRFPPIEYCPFCHAGSSEWVSLPGTGAVQSFVVVHRAFDQHFAGEVPYAVGMIQLDGTAPPVVVPGLVREVPVDQVEVGMRVRAGYEPYDEAPEVAMAVFVPAGMQE